MVTPVRLMVLVTECCVPPLEYWSAVNGETALLLPQLMRIAVAGTDPLPLRVAEAPAVVDRVAVLLPADVGVKVTTSVQLEAAANEAEQVVAPRAKPLDAVMDQPPKDNAIEALLVNVTVRLVLLPTLVLAKLTGLGVMVRAPTSAVPLSEAVPVPTVRLAVLLPADSGLKSTPTVQVAPAANVVPQPFWLIWNWLASVPVMVGAVNEIAAGPGLVTEKTAEAMPPT